MNGTLYKISFRSNWVVLVIFLGILFMYMSMMVAMYDPDGVEALEGWLELMPKGIVAMMGFEDLAVDLAGFVGNFIYSFLAIMFPLIFTIIVANRLIAGHVDRGSMAYLLATPNSRVVVATTQAAYLLSGVTILFAVLAGTGVLFSELLFPGHLDIGRFLVLNGVSLVIFFAVTGICFFFSCLFDETRYSLALGGGITVLFFVINMLANVNEQMEWLRYLTLFTLQNPTRILEGGSFVALALAVPAVIAVLTYAGGIWLFNKRSLPL